MSEQNASATRTQTADFGAGCFWQVEEAFRELDGVLETAVGYEGGHVDNPTYEQVCAGDTGHVEVARITYDPDRVSFEQLVDKYLQIHDPTQLNRQGPNVGFQYRSVIFAHDPEQEGAARAAIERAQADHRDPIMTAIEPAATFWRAEDYHQCYLQKRGTARGVLGQLLGR